MSGKPPDIEYILNLIRTHVPNILSERAYDSRDNLEEVNVYFQIADDLQLRAMGNLQDWAIIEYCQELRSTSKIMRYFGLDYDQARELLDRLVNSGDLVREVIDKSYSYIDATKVVWCRKCIYYDEEGICCKVSPMHIVSNTSWQNCCRHYVEGDRRWSDSPQHAQGADRC